MPRRFNSTQPLSGIRVLDLTRILAGPYCTMKLGDMGAEVIKVERPGHGDDTRIWAPPYIGEQSAYFFSINRNKKSIALDFSTTAGKKILASLAAECDVLVDNFLPGTLNRLGLSPNALRKRNPRLIHCTITAYGGNTRRKHDPAYELIVQGESGLMDLTGFPDGPPTKTGISISDITTGNNAFSGILLALFRRERTGKGARVEVSLIESILSAFTFQAQIALGTTGTAKRMGNLHPTITPYETFRTRDGYMNIAVANETAWRRFCAAIGNISLADEPKFRTNPLRVHNRKALQRLLIPVVRSKTTRAWLAAFKKAGVAAGRVNTVYEALRTPEVLQSGLLWEVQTQDGKRVKTVGNPIRIAGMKQTPPLPPPLLGEHTNEILKKINRNR